MKVLPAESEITPLSCTQIQAPCSFSYLKVIDLQREAREEGGGRKRRRGDRGYVYFSAEPPWFGADDVSNPSCQTMQCVERLAACGAPNSSALPGTRSRTHGGRGAAPPRLTGTQPPPLPFNPLHQLSV